MTLFGCGLQDEGLEITLGDLGLPLGYTDVPLEGTTDLSPALLEVQNVPPAPSRLLNKVTPNQSPSCSSCFFLETGSKQK